MPCATWCNLPIHPFKEVPKLDSKRSMLWLVLAWIRNSGPLGRCAPASRPMPPLSSQSKALRHGPFQSVHKDADPFAFQSSSFCSNVRTQRLRHHNRRSSGMSLSEYPPPKDTVVFCQVGIDGSSREVAQGQCVWYYCNSEASHAESETHEKLAQLEHTEEQNTVATRARVDTTQFAECLCHLPSTRKERDRARSPCQQTHRQCGAHDGATIVTCLVPSPLRPISIWMRFAMRNPSPCPERKV